MSLRKVFSIAIASIALLLFIFMFLPYNGLLSKVNHIAIIDGNMWSFSVAFSIFILIGLIAIIALYVLNIFGIVNDKLISYANYATGFITFFNLCYLFLVMDVARIGIWLAAIFSVIMLALTVVWNFLSDKPFAGKEKAPITGYDPATGKPIYAKPKGFDPQTGAPIY